MATFSLNGKQVEAPDGMNLVHGVASTNGNTRVDSCNEA